MKKTIIFLIALILLSGFVYAEGDQTQQYSKIYLSPYYVDSLINGATTNFSVTVAPPDGVTQVFSAIVTFEAYISPTVNFELKVNGQSCIPPVFQISTTYMSAGKGSVSFDCSNVIKSQGTYLLSLKTTKNTGATYGYLDIAYSNKPLAKVEIHGTEYNSGEIAKAWLQLLNNSNQIINDAICYLSVYSPTNQDYIFHAQMVENGNGIHYYDFIVPAVSGVYPQIADCYYTSSSVKHNATSYRINQGAVHPGDTLDLTYFDEGTSGDLMLIRENTSSGNRILSIDFNFTTTDCMSTPENILTGGTLFWKGIWNPSPSNDEVIGYIYNYTSGNWVALSNHFTYTTSEIVVTNSLTFNNMTKVGIVDANGQVRIRFNDTIGGGSDGSSQYFQTGYMYFGCDQLSENSWQNVKGSSEMHVRNPDGYTFLVDTLCGDTTSDCATLENDLEYYNFSEGYVFENITITNVAEQTYSGEYITYETSYGNDCTAILEIYQDVDGDVTDLYDDTIFSTGSNRNCKMKIPIIMYGDDESLQIIITVDNYARWDLDYYKDLFGLANQTISEFCEPYAESVNYTYVIPFSLYDDWSGGEDSVLLGCQRAMDDLWYMEDNYQNSLSATTAGELEGYLILAEWYHDKIYEEYIAIELELNGIYSLSNTQALANIPTNVWNHTTRNLTYYEAGNVSINTTLIAEDVWQYNETINPNLIAQFVENIWSYTGAYGRYIWGTLGDAIDNII